jgi:DNA-directed RNA polymerase subunit H (RpoH/RPB5)
MSSTTSSTLRKNEKAIKIAKEMFKIRKYTLLHHESDHLIATNKRGEKVYFWLILYEKLNIEIIKYYYTLLYKDGINHGILVYRNNVTSSVTKILLGNHDIRIELFHIDELQYNLTKHVLVPLHEKISAKGHTELSKYPILKKTDPVARFNGWVNGDLIKITRKDGTISFRIVR